MTLNTDGDALMRYAYSIDGGENYFSYDFASREAAAMEAVSDASCYEPGEEHAILTAEVDRPRAGDLAPDAWSLIESMTDADLHELPEAAVGWLENVTPEQRDDLEKVVADAINAWADKHKLQPRWFLAKDPQETVVRAPGGTKSAESVR